MTFRVADETFRALLVGDEHIEAARAAQAGGSARIPNGRIVRGTGVNSGWSWHLEDVEFVEVSIELCDALEKVSASTSLEGAQHLCIAHVRSLPK